MPIGKQYKTHKNNVIDLFDGYKNKRGDLNDGVDIKFLEQRVDTLKNGKFTLAVAGEVKAGKSTFINALLGAEILPTDVLQASSAIVEIFKSENSVLKVKFSDGHEEILSDDLDTPTTDEAKERLHEICRLHDAYRDIPTTLIDACIVESNELLEVNNELITKLQKSSGMKNLEHNQDKIESYILERTKDKIPVEITFGYPLKWDFEELRIVDAPGVNATGGVQDVAFDFFESANAILFVHPIKPIESESFKKFVDSVISDRSKETLFLILTHAGIYSNDEVERLQGEAKRLYGGLIPQDRVLVVDSLLKLIHCDLEQGVSVQEIRKSENKKKILSSYREQAEDEGRELIDVIYEASRFKRMFSAIDEFSMKAPNIQLQEILEKVKSGYEKQEELIGEKSSQLELKKRNPQEFEEEINRINKALEKYKLLTRKTEEELRSNYSGRHSSWQKDIEALKDKYQKLIEGSDSIESARKHTVDAINAIQNKADEFSRELTKRLEDALNKEDKSFKEEHRISIPKVDLKALEEKSKEAAYKEKETGYWDKEPIWKIWKWGSRDYYVKTGTKQEFDNEKFLDGFKTRCNEEFYKIVNNLPNQSKVVLDLYLQLFTNKMDSVIKERQKALEQEKDKKRSNEEIANEIKDLDRKKKDIQPEIKRCNEVLEDIQ
ncbi:dynamin family protein [Advenella alkanexedens]|uniref:Dynamin family protein n=1 Tax=Advenella alkanexedens TaxID=1481665 RepID=A0ABS6NL32_9BURK|nr:dynamin family protein [Advenella alkanexedens]MBV4396338.1 dynamin family protein [Advenella alkanexedens]